MEKEILFQEIDLMIFLANNWTLQIQLIHLWIQLA